MSQTQGPQIEPRDALEIAQKALRQTNQLEQTVTNLQNRVQELEAAIPDRSEYSELDRDTKVGMVKQHLVNRAQDQHGKAAIDYDGVMWEVFDGEPSADHCYTLMQKAANTDGFELQNPENGNRRLTVNIRATNAQTNFSHANKDMSEGGV